MHPSTGLLTFEAENMRRTKRGAIFYEHIKDGLGAFVGARQVTQVCPDDIQTIIASLHAMQAN
eukprot:10544174-Prorocentrum_lima.AAC.1